jgi:transcription elongation factor GreA
MTQAEERVPVWLTQAKFDALQEELEELRGPGRADDGVVEQGMVVTYRFVGDDEKEKFLLGAREMKGDDDDLEVYSPQSPLGAAINGKQKGDTVEYVAPNGKTLKVEIVDAVPYQG